MSDEDKTLGANKSSFIISPIGNKLEPVGSAGRNRYEESAIFWEEVVEPACAQFGLNPVRADRITETGEIPDQIFTYLRDADVVIADLSHANPNVMYELGLRHSIANKITIQLGEYGFLPFDVTTIRTIQFKRTTVGLVSARDELIVSLRTALNGGGSPLRATTIFTSGSTISPEKLAADHARSTEVDEVEEYESRPGFVDILAEGEESTTHIAEVLGSASELFQQVGQLVKDAGEEATTAEVVKKGFAGRLLLMRKLANDLNEPSEELEIASNEFYSDAMKMDAMVRYIVTRLESGDEELDEDSRVFIKSIIGLAESAEEGAIGVLGFRDGTKTLAKMATDLRPTAKQLGSAAGRFIEGIDVVVSWRAMVEPFVDESAA